MNPALSDADGGDAGFRIFSKLFVGLLVILFIAYRHGWPHAMEVLTRSGCIAVSMMAFLFAVIAVLASYQVFFGPPDKRGYNLQWAAMSTAIDAVAFLVFFRRDLLIRLLAKSRQRRARRSSVPVTPAFTGTATIVNIDPKLCPKVVERLEGPEQNQPNQGQLNGHRQAAALTHSPAQLSQKRDEQEPASGRA